MKVLLIGNLAEDRQESMQRFTALLHTGLLARGHEVTVLTPTLRLARLGPAYHYGGLPKYLGYFDKFVLFPRQLRRFIRSLQPDVVHITDHSNAMYVSAAAGVPTLVTCHDLLQVRAALGEIPQQKVSWVGRKYQAWIRGSLARMSLIAAVSTHTREKVLHILRVPPDRVSLVPNALNFPYQPVPPDAARLQLQALARRRGFDAALLDAPGGFLLHVGGGQWYKNREGLLAIYAHLRSLLTPAPRLMMVGPPMAAMDAALATQVISVQGVTNPELEALYNRAEALVFPSWAEGFGWPVAEAQACGCPVFATHRAPMTEVGGNSSVYFDPENPAEAAQIIAAAWPRRTLRRDRALEEAKRWQLAPMLDGYEALYRQLLQ